VCVYLYICIFVSVFLEHIHLFMRTCMHGRTYMYMAYVSNGVHNDTPSIYTTHFRINRRWLLRVDASDDLLDGRSV